MSKFLISLFFLVAVPAFANEEKEIKTEVTCGLAVPDGVTEIYVGVTRFYGSGLNAVVVEKDVATQISRIVLSRRVFPDTTNNVAVYRDSLSSFALAITTLEDGTRVGNLNFLMENGGVSIQGITCSAAEDKLIYTIVE